MTAAGRILSILTVMVIGMVILLYYSRTGLLESIETKTYDWRLRDWRGPLAPTGTIAIIAIDEKSISDLGRFPWNRQHFADLIKTVAAAGARGLVLDVLFSEAQNPAADQALAKAVEHSGITYLGGAFSFASDGSPEAFLQNLPILTRAARSTAHINVFPDDDGVLRWTRLAIAYQNHLYPSLGLAAALAAADETAFSLEPLVLQAGSLTVPTDPEQHILINFRGPTNTFEHFSFVDVLKGRVPAAALKDKVLMVGPTAIGIYDMRVTPFSSNTPGVEVHANVADNLLRGDSMQRGGTESLIDLLAISLLGLLVAVITLHLRAAAALPVVCALTLGYLWFTCVRIGCGQWLSVVYPLLSIVLVYLIASYLRFFFLDRKARQIRAMFSCYVSKKIVDEIVKNPELAKIGGDSKIVTILFADIKNYTGYSEQHSPQDVVRILNEYLGEMTHVILKYDGTLDKFMGDGILAYWGAPLPQANHAELAVRCALEMLQRLRTLHAKWEKEGTEPFSCGIGMHTGEVIAGNIGAENKKMDYTIIGDAVNLSFRIQNESRHVNAPVITEPLYEQVKDMVLIEALGPVLVKGKNVPVNIFALKGLREPALPN